MARVSSFHLRVDHILGAIADEAHLDNFAPHLPSHSLTLDATVTRLRAAVNFQPDGIWIAVACPVTSKAPKATRKKTSRSRSGPPWSCTPTNWDGYVRTLALQHRARPQRRRRRGAAQLPASALSAACPDV
jgi:hypothetical protein